MTGMLAVGKRLSWVEARQSPCATCLPSYCCTHVLLHQFNLRSLVHVDFARYLLNFEGILIGLDEEFTASVYLNQPCSYLDTELGACTVYDTDTQPAECRHYPAFDCSARRVMSAGNDQRHPILDRARFDWLCDRLYFDEERTLEAGPLWPEILAGFESIPLSRQPAPPPQPDPVLAEWKEVVLGRKESSAPVRPHRWGDPALTDPCSGCQAYCCEVLVFDRPMPGSAGDLEHLRFLLGFPSIELAITETGWRLFVHVRCQHLSGTECSLFGQPERPLHCGALPAVGCEFKAEFSRVDPERSLRIGRDLFPVVENAIAFADDGRVMGIPPMPFLRRVVQEALVQAG